MNDAESMDEEALAHRARDGDSNALLTLLDLYDGLVRLRVGQLLPVAIRRRVSVSDVMQETRLEVVSSVERFEWRGDGSFRAWLMRVAANQAKKVVRTHMTAKKRSQRQEVTRAQRLETAMHALHTVTPSQVVMAEELQARVRRALNELPADYREVLRLCREEELTLREAALRMGRSREATKKLYARALAKFARIVEEGGGLTDVR